MKKKKRRLKLKKIRMKLIINQERILSVLLKNQKNQFNQSKTLKKKRKSKILNYLKNKKKISISLVK